jgi:hypothetical protein
MASSSAIITDVLHELRCRKGFDEFWEQVDPDIQEGLISDLEEIVNDHLDGDDEAWKRTNNTVKSVTIVRKGDAKRLFDVRAETESGYQIRLPIMGMRHEENFRENGVVYLGFGTHRVAYEDIA